jgi:FtsP/CotA-like multicopper oxidase with cupredoxin domain
MRLFMTVSVAASLLLVAGHAPAQPASGPASTLPLIAANDNRRAGGERTGNVLRLRLVADEGRWQPEGPDGRTLFVQAFREEGGELTTPGPLVRVAVGTEIVVSVRNNLRGRLSVAGFVTRPTASPARLARGDSLRALRARITTGRRPPGVRWSRGAMSTVS